MDRNIAAVHLLINNGLSLQELVGLQMKNVHFENNTISVPGIAGIERPILLTEDDKKILFNYYKTIPEPVRPKYHSNDPLFVAFDFTRKTYHWSYENNAPKALTEIAIQNEVLEEEIIKQVGFKFKLSLKRYYDYIDK